MLLNHLIASNGRIIQFSTPNFCAIMSKTKDCTACETHRRRVVLGWRPTESGVSTNEV